MNSPSMALRVAAIVFGVVCLGHIWRLIEQFDVRIGPHHIPMWLSVVAALGAALLSFWMWRLSINR